MIRSMTGYARAETQGPWGRLNWELRSVNHRYLDLQFKLPEDFRVAENEWKAMAGAHLARGKVEIGLRYVRDASAAATLEINEHRLEQVRMAIERVTASLTGTALPDPLKMLTFPGVVQEETQNLAPMLQAAKQLFAEALKQFVDARAREGGRLEQFLVERCDSLQRLSILVRARYLEVRVNWLERLRAKARDLGVELDPGRLEQELVLSLQRLDVEEELSRLESHLVEVRSALGRDEATGRRLDFLMQELNREANTLSSKSQDAEMTRHAVEMKVLIEQMREQVQNIE
jgi:uncharacterized protein (TIGR00255 family)